MAIARDTSAGSSSIWRCVNRRVRQPAAAWIASRRRSDSKLSLDLWCRQESVSTRRPWPAKTKSTSKALDVVVAARPGQAGVAAEGEEALLELR